MQFFAKMWDLSICSWLENVRTLGESKLKYTQGTDHAYTQKAVE